MKNLKYIFIVVYIPLAFLYYYFALNSFSKKEDEPSNKIADLSDKKQNILTSEPESNKLPIGQKEAITPPVPRGGTYHDLATKDVSNKNTHPESVQIKQKENTIGHELVANPLPSKREIPPPRPLPQSQEVANPVLTDIPDKVSKSVNASEVMSFQKALDLADRGDARAQAIVSIYYQVGYKTRKDISKASEYALRSAKQHNPLGMYRLAVMMENGEGFEKNVEQGRRLKELSFEGLVAMGGDPYALTAIGIMLFRGEGGLTQDRSEAVRLYKKAADMGYAPAQYNYSAALALGQGIAKNEDESLKWWRRAYEQDYPPAMSGPVGEINSKPQQNQKTSLDTTPKPKPTVNKRLPRGIPVAGRPGFVSSPYAPGAGGVDARGVKSGDLLTCPFTKQPFIMP